MNEYASGDKNLNSVRSKYPVVVTWLLLTTVQALLAGPAVGEPGIRGLADERAAYTTVVLSQETDGETYAMSAMCEYLRLRGYQLEDIGILPYDSGVTMTTFNLTRGHHEALSTVEMYEFPSAETARSFDVVNSNFAKEMVDCPTREEWNAYIREYCTAYRRNNLAMLMFRHMHYHGRAPAHVRDATQDEDEFVRDFTHRFTMRRLADLQRQAAEYNQAMNLVTDGDMSQIEEGVGRLAMIDPQELHTEGVFAALQNATDRIDGHVRHLEADVKRDVHDRMVEFAGLEQVPWLLAQGQYQRVAEVGDSTALMTLLAITDSAVAHGDTPIPVLRATIDLLYRLQPQPSPTAAADAADITRCLDDELRDGQLAALWQRHYAGIDRYEIHGLHTIGNYAGARVIFPGSGLSGGSVVVYLQRIEGCWRMVAIGSCIIS